MTMKMVAFQEVAWSFSYQPAMSIWLIDEHEKGGSSDSFAGVFHISQKNGRVSYYIPEIFHA